jgi:hypothetical protein
LFEREAAVGAQCPDVARELASHASFAGGHDGKLGAARG